MGKNQNEFETDEARAFYVDGLKQELANSRDAEHSKAVKAELARVSNTRETAVAPKATETA